MELLQRFSRDDSSHRLLEVLDMKQSGPSHNQINININQIKQLLIIIRFSLKAQINSKCRMILLWQKPANHIAKYLDLELNQIILIQIKPISRMFRKLKNILFRKSFDDRIGGPRRKSPFFLFKNVGFKRITITGTLLFFIYMSNTQNRKEQLQFIGHKTDLNQRLFFSNKELCETSFSKSLILRNRWLQRFFSLYLETYKIINVEKQQFEEGVIRTFPKKNYHLKELENLSALIIVGGTESFDQLMKETMLMCKEQKFEVFGVNIKDFHNEQKFLKLMEFIKKKSKATNFYCVGIEYGANLMTIAAAKNPNLFNAIASIGNPLNLEQSQKNLEKDWFGKFIMKSIISGRLKSFQLLQRGKLKFDFPEQDRNLYSIDKYIYKLKAEELPNFKAIKSSIYYLQDLQVHSLFINSQQDPFSKITQEIEVIAEKNANLLFISTKNGGHTEFFYSFKNYRWPPLVIAQHFRIIDQLLKNNPQLFKLQ